MIPRQLHDLYHKGVMIPLKQGMDVTPIVQEISKGAAYSLFQYGDKWLVSRQSALATEVRIVPVKGVIYIAGPMRGYVGYNFPAFDKARDYFIAQGFYVFNPADLDRAVGVHEDTDPLPPGFMSGAMRRDTNAICYCTHIALLKGWEESSGVQAEAILSNTLGLVFLVEVDLNRFIPQPKEAVCAVIGARLIAEYQKMQAALVAPATPAVN